MWLMLAHSYLLVWLTHPGTAIRFLCISNIFLRRSLFGAQGRYLKSATLIIPLNRGSSFRERQSLPAALSNLTEFEFEVSDSLNLIVISLFCPIHAWLTFSITHKCFSTSLKIPPKKYFQQSVRDSELSLPRVTPATDCRRLCVLQHIWMDVEHLEQ